MNRREFSKLVGLSLLPSFAFGKTAPEYDGEAIGMTQEQLLGFRAVFENTQFHINPDTFYMAVNEKVYRQLKSLVARDDYHRSRRAVRLRRWLNERRNG